MLSTTIGDQCLLSAAEDFNSPTLTGSTFIACHMAPPTIKTRMIYFPAFGTLFLFAAIIVAFSMIGFRESFWLAYARIVVGLH